jgi:hypothetical protein
VGLTPPAPTAPPPHLVLRVVAGAPSALGPLPAAHLPFSALPFLFIYAQVSFFFLAP